ncbi:VOC family protein [Gorillibacterium timonense]|uniref:VOC family protein n=1 Tax=Gorillibacterium timonense TaxID=1689269 RepID=UPI00071D7063|nr:VOC family protein [Gorillibacterium timonense]
MEAFVHHICIQTNQYEASLAFYQKLGFQLVQETPGFHGRSYNTWLTLNGFHIELQTGKDRLNPASGSDHEGLVHFCIWVEELEKALSVLDFDDSLFLLKNGKRIYTVENGQLCKLKAPEGTIVELRNQRGI